MSEARRVETGSGRVRVRQSSRSGVPLSARIADLTAGLGGTKGQLGRLRARWPLLVGRAHSVSSVAHGLRDGVLEVLVSNDVVRRELALARESLIAGCNEALGQRSVRILRFRRVEAAGFPQDATRPEPARQARVGRMLSDGENREVSALFAGIADPEVRAAFEQMRRQHLRFDGSISRESNDQVHGAEQ